MTPGSTSDAAAVSVDGLVKRYGDHDAVRGISFEVRRGEVLGLLGPNGAGKTSTVEILCGLRPRDAGTVSVLGLDPADRRQLQQIRARVGVVLQDSAHYRFLTVRETLAMHANYHPDPRGVDEVLSLVDLTDGADRRIRELSGGQQRRLDVAVALVGRPELIFLDEPTTGFDPAARRRFWATIRGLRDLGTSILLTTHYMEEAQELADRVAIMRGGQIVGVGTAHELADQVAMGSLVSFALPEGIGVADLPAAIAAAVASTGPEPDARLELRTARPTELLAQLCGWAVERGVELVGLELRAPSLEESYLLLTEPGAGETTTGATRAAAPAIADTPRAVSR